MYHLVDAYLFSGFVAVLAAYIGALTFGTSAVPVVITGTLDESLAGPVLRRYWPLYHRFAVAGGTALTVALVVIAPADVLPAIYTLLLTGLAALMTVCFFVGMRLIGAINAARDRGDDAAFNRLHRFDVLLVGTGLLIGVALLCAVIYVLPGQFTFWQHAADHTSASL